MYYILILWPFVAVSTLILLWGVDKELKYLKELNIKKAKLLNLSKFGFLFLYHKRNEKNITRFAFINTIVLYAINVLAAAFLISHLITKIDLLFIICIVTFLLNMIMAIYSLLRISLNGEQRKIKHEDQKKRRSGGN